MSVADYLYELKELMEVILIAGIMLRAVETILKIGLEQGDWTTTLQKIKRLVMVAILGVGTMEFVFLLKRSYFGG